MDTKVEKAEKVEKVGKATLAMVAKINQHLGRSVADIIEIGREMFALRQACEEGTWIRLFPNHKHSIAVPLRMSKSVGTQWAAIGAKADYLSQPDVQKALPSSVDALYQITLVPDETVVEAVSKGEVKPTMTVLQAGAFKCSKVPSTRKPSAPRVASAIVPGKTPLNVAEVNGRSSNGDRAVMMLGDAVKGVLVVAKAGQLTEAHQEIVARYSNQMLEALSILRVKPSDASTVVAKHEPEIEKMAEKLVEKVEAHAKAKSRSRKPKPSADPVEEIATEVVASL